MSIRAEPLVTNSVYHVFNKTTDHRKIFTHEQLCHHFCSLLSYYRSSAAVLSYSRLASLDAITRHKIMQRTLLPKTHTVEILAYTLMPNHFHILLRQSKDGAISNLMSNMINAFTRHYNLMSHRVGPVFLPIFKAVKIKSDEQLMHVSRYIHLNPYSSGLVLSHSSLVRYRWSSYHEYLTDLPETLSHSKRVLELFNNDKKRYRQFVESYADIQRSREIVKHAIEWEQEAEKRKRACYLD